jgi:hypothetical protein
MQSNDNDEQRTPQSTSMQAETDNFCPTFDSSHNIQGKVFFLPSSEELPYRAVSRVRPRQDKGKRIESGLYSHPIVVISRPHDEGDIVHFHPVCLLPQVKSRNMADLVQITTFQGRRIEQIYDEKSVHQANRRGWFLPIAPTPDHPDHDPTRENLKMPTLELGSGATLRSRSYVNVRYVFSIDRSLLQPYYNPNAPSRHMFRFTRDSTNKMLRRGRVVQTYVPGRQFGDAPEPTPAFTDDEQRVRRDAVDREPLIAVEVMPTVNVQRKPLPKSASTSAPMPAPTDIDRTVNRNGADREPLIVVGVLPTTTTPRGSSAASGRIQGDFRMLNIGDKRIAGTRQKEPPDESSPVVMAVRPMVQFLEGFESIAAVTHQRLMALSYDPNAIKRPLDRAWRDFKGVTAIAIASI